MNRQTALMYRKRIEQAVVSLPDEQALDIPEMYPHWREDIKVTAGERLFYRDKLYRVVQSHTTQKGWEPDVVPALFTEVPKPGEIPVWKQPTGAHDAYNKGDKVRHKGSIWVSAVDANTWEPGVFGWETER